MADRVFITGAAGFIGFHLARRLLRQGCQVLGFDGMTPYYDPALKAARLAQLQSDASFSFEQGLLEEEGRLSTLVRDFAPTVIVHLAAQAGVQYSLKAPRSYASANLTGTLEILEAARAAPPRHLVLASSSSAYGANTQMPYAEQHQTARPMSLYAATKIANEAMGHSYAHLYGIPTTMVRFFTVYGPWGRPDMAFFKFTSAILNGAPIDVYHQGEARRDFTYVDDLVEGLVRLTATVPGMVPVDATDTLSEVAPFRVVNLGAGTPVALTDFIAAIETAVGRPAKRRMLPAQAGDVPATWADTRLAEALIGPLPKTPLVQGVGQFVDWYRDWIGAEATGRSPAVAPR